MMYDLSDKNPKKLALRWLRGVIPGADRDSVVGDLSEEYREVRLPRSGRLRAELWLWSQVLRSAAFLLYDRVRRGGHHRSEPTREIPEARGDGSMAHFLQDLRYGARTLLKSPGFSFLTVFTLALAIGVNSAIFSMLNVVLLRPLPIGDPDTVAFVYTRNPDRNIEQAPVSPGDFLDLRREIDAFEQLGALNRNAAFVLTGLDEPVRMAGFEATANVLEIWQLPVVIGRSFQEGDDLPGAERVALLAHRAWEDRFGRDPDIVGRVVEIDGRPTTIVGVVSPEIEFGSLAAAEIWLPLVLEEANARRDVRNLWVTGRLAPGASVEQARQEVLATAERLEREHPEESAGWRLTVFDMNQALAPPQTWALLALLGLTVGLVMLIACSNVATMMITRAQDRGRELAVRAAIGARRGRILSQLLAEAVLLAAAACALGLLFAKLSLAALVWLAGDNSGLTGFFSVLSIDRNVLLFTIAVSASAPILFGLLPALRASRPDLSDALREGSRGSTGARELGRRALVTAQIALALALLTVAGLAMQAIHQQQATPAGFDTANLLTMRLQLPSARYETPESWRDFFGRALERTGALPGVESAWLTSDRYAESAPTNRNFSIEGRPAPRPQESPYGGVWTVSAGALDLEGVTIVNGRDFTFGDGPDDRAVAVVNRAAAERFWPDTSPIGARIRLAGDGEPWREIVGVADNLFTGDPANPTAPVVYLPFAQDPRSSMGLMVRTAAEPTQLAQPVRDAIWSIDPDQPIGDVRTMERLIDDAMRSGTTMLSIFVFFAFFALLMAGAGLYGVISYTVGRRTREIGIRMALGAHRDRVIGLVARQTAWLVAIGLVLGMALSLLVGRLVASAIGGVDPSDPLLLSGVAGVLAVTAVFATLLPTRRALSIEPASALRRD